MAKLCCSTGSRAGSWTWCRKARYCKSERKTLWSATWVGFFEAKGWWSRNSKDAAVRRDWKVAEVLRWDQCTSSPFACPQYFFWWASVRLSNLSPSWFVFGLWSGHGTCECDIFFWATWWNLVSDTEHGGIDFCSELTADVILLSCCPVVYVGTCGWLWQCIGEPVIVLLRCDSKLCYVGTFGWFESLYWWICDCIVIVFVFWNVSLCMWPELMLLGYQMCMLIWFVLDVN